MEEKEAAEAYIVPMYSMEAVVVCLEIPPPVQGLDLSRQVLIQAEAVCSRQTA